jgi:hypothetical protein
LFKTTHKLPKQTLLFVAPQSQLSDFAALLEAYHAQGIAVDLVRYTEKMPDMRSLVGTHPNLDAAVLAGSARYAPGTALPGPTLRNAAKKQIPVAWLPIRNSNTNRRFAETAARVQGRRRQKATVALLSQWHPRYLRLSDRLETLLQNPVELFRWTGERITRESVVEALGAGLGLALYLGHGRPNGLVGYYGMRARHFDDFQGEPLGAMVSLCCRTASRRRTGLSYTEALPLLGVAAASFGAITETRHTDNTRWSVRMCTCLAQGVETLGDLVVRATPPNPTASTPYRIIGDPLAPLFAETSGARRAKKIKTYP